MDRSIWIKRTERWPFGFGRSAVGSGFALWAPGAWGNSAIGCPPWAMGRGPWVTTRFCMLAVTHGPWLTAHGR